MLYLSYGRGIHEDEVIFSILTAAHRDGLASRGIEIFVYTDHPESFTSLPATIHHVPTEQWDSWSGPSGFNHRRKILALQDCLDRTNRPTVLLDGDTWWRRPASEIFDRIGPGRSVMHLREGIIHQTRSSKAEAMADFLCSHTFFDPVGKEVSFEPSSTMWNAGVIGIHPADRALLDEVLHWTDQFCQHGNLHVLEQFAFSQVLSRRTRLSESGDLVFHYWPPYLHDPFRRRLSAIMAAGRDLPLAERARHCYAFRPRPGFPRRCKVVLKRILQGLGLLRGRIRTNEW